MTATDTQIAVRIGQVWQPKQADHLNERCVVVGVNTVSARLRTLKNHHTNSMGGSSKNRDQFFHRTLDELHHAFTLVRDAPEDEKQETTERPMTEKESKRKAQADRFDALSTKDRIEILEARQHRMEHREILRTWDIEPAVLGMLLAWAGDEYPEKLVIFDEPTVDEMSSAALQGVTGTANAALPHVPTAAEPMMTEQEVLAVYAAATEPIEMKVEPTPHEMQPMTLGRTPQPQTEFTVEMLVLQPMRVTRTFTASSYAAVEQIVGSEVEHLIEIVGITKVAK